MPQPVRNRLFGKQRPPLRRSQDRAVEVIDLEQHSDGVDQRGTADGWVCGMCYGIPLDLFIVCCHVCKGVTQRRLDEYLGSFHT